MRFLKPWGYTGSAIKFNSKTWVTLIGADWWLSGAHANLMSQPLITQHLLRHRWLIWHAPTPLARLLFMSLCTSLLLWQNVCLDRGARCWRKWSSIPSRFLLFSNNSINSEKEGSTKRQTRWGLKMCLGVCVRLGWVNMNKHAQVYEQQQRSGSIWQCCFKSWTTQNWVLL